jgi:UDP-N-acetylmuramoylalanine--D-glutamate ligase
MKRATKRKAQIRHAVVVGLGVTGVSCVRHLLAQRVDVSVVDSRPQPPKLAEFKTEFPDVPVHTGELDARRLGQAELLVVSPGVSLKEPAIAQAIAEGREAVGDIELFARDAGAPVIAITGANGKSTVTALVGEMCRVAGLATAVGGNIGVPALSLLGDPEPDVYVLELSSFQLETTSSLNARAATVLNITPDHMDRYRDLDEYANAKARVFNGDGIMVLNADDPIVMGMARPNRQIIHFSLSEPVRASDYGLRERNGTTWLVRGDEDLLPAHAIPLSGKHNFANVLAAFAIVEAAGVARAAAFAAVQAFRGLKHRTQLVLERDGIRWINDSKGTNVGAAVAALNGMTSPVVLIAGGDGKGADFSDLREACRTRARAVVLIGRDGPLIEQALAGVVPVKYARDMPDAVRAAQTLAKPGDIVLLSPACASFDMFDNYEHRGDAFRAAVLELYP